MAVAVYLASLLRGDFVQHADGKGCQLRVRKTNPLTESGIRGPTMTFRLILLCAAVLTASPALARKNNDIILMRNGDRITCEIKGLRSNTLYISVPYILGTLSVDWSEVDHLESKQLFLVKTQDGTVYTGALSAPKTSGERPMLVEVLETPESKVTLERKQVVEVNQTAGNFWQRLNGEIGTGFSYSKGNQSTQYSLNSDVSYPRERWSAGVRYTSNLTSNSGSSVSNRNEVTLSALRLLRWNNWYYTGLTDFLQSSVQGIRLQSTFGGGIGRNIINTGSTFFTIFGGFAWQKINYNEAVFTTSPQQVTSGLIGTNLRLFQFDKTTLVVNAYLLPAISQPGRLHFNLESSYYVKFWGKLNWNFTTYYTWDNRPPPGFVGTDYGATSGISLTFGNR
jgi:hypothetical protein